jgi:hypothetical protein
VSGYIPLRKLSCLRTHLSLKRGWSSLESRLLSLEPTEIHEKAAGGPGQTQTQQLSWRRQWQVQIWWIHFWWHKQVTQNHQFVRVYFYYLRAFTGQDSIFAESWVSQAIVSSPGGSSSSASSLVVGRGYLLMLILGLRSSAVRGCLPFPVTALPTAWQLLLQGQQWVSDALNLSNSISEPWILFQRAPLTRSGLSRIISILLTHNEQIRYCYSVGLTCRPKTHVLKALSLIHSATGTWWNL